MHGIACATRNGRASPTPAGRPRGFGGGRRVNERGFTRFTPFLQKNFNQSPTFADAKRATVALQRPTEPP